MPESLTFYAACAVVVARFPSSYGSFLFRNNLRMYCYGVMHRVRYNGSFIYTVGFNVVYETYAACYQELLAQMTY